MSIDKINLIPVWDEVRHLFSEQERAALAWAEEVTRVSEPHASDEAYAAASAHFAPKDKNTVVVGRVAARHEDPGIAAFQTLPGPWDPDGSECSRCAAGTDARDREAGST